MSTSKSFQQKKLFSKKTSEKQRYQKYNYLSVRHLLRLASRREETVELSTPRIADNFIAMSNDFDYQHYRLTYTELSITPPPPYILIIPKLCKLGN